MLKNLKSFKEKIPYQIRLFLGKALVFFIVWKLIYNFFLYDSKYLDHPLTTHIGEASAFVLNNFTSMDSFSAVREMSSYVFEGGTTYHESSAIYHYDYIVLYIANNCNGLELIVLFIGFIVCLPSSFWRKLKYIIIGTIIIDGVNILRCVGLIYLQEYYELYFDFAHHYLFKAVVYTVTFLIWYVFARKIKLSHETV